MLSGSTASAAKVADLMTRLDADPDAPPNRAKSLARALKKGEAQRKVDPTGQRGFLSKPRQKPKTFRNSAVAIQIVATWILKFTTLIGIYSRGR